MFPAALQWVTLGFLEKISSAVACAGSYIYFFKGKLKSYVHWGMPFKCGRHGYITAKIARN